MNRGNDFRPYFSHPATTPTPTTTTTTTNPRYEHSPNPSGQVGIDRHALNRQGYEYGDGSLSPRNREFGFNHRPSIQQDYGDGNRFSYPRNRLYGLEHRRPSFQHEHTRMGAPAEYRPFEERLAIRPFSHTTSISTEGPNSARISPEIIIIGSNMNSDSASPRFPLSNSRGMMNTVTETETDNDSKLTKEEQEEALKKLKKEIYNPAPNNKTLARRVSLYYRDLNRDVNPKNSNKDEDGKRCAVCLEDFEAKEQVMLTPCNHMFHEECIVPWVKSQGQCPVCRSAFCDNGSRVRRTGNTNNNVAAHHAHAHAHFEEELFSLIRAVNEAFPWVA